MITADRERIGQVLNNLLSNAVKYSPAGGEVVVELEVAGREVRVSITDQGIGVAKEMQDKVFNRFFRVQHAQANLFPGMGLGLYITAGIIGRHGGTIGVKGNEGIGAKFYFTLLLEAES